jgi:hypothetical protein
MSNNDAAAVRDSLIRRLAEAEDRGRLHRRVTPIVDCIRNMRLEGLADNEIAAYCATRLTSYTKSLWLRTGNDPAPKLNCRNSVWWRTDSPVRSWPSPPVARMRAQKQKAMVDPITSGGRTDPMRSL